MENPLRHESTPKRFLARAGLALGALTMGFMVTPEGPLDAGDIWVDGYAAPIEGSAETVDHMTIATYNVKNGSIDKQGVIDTVRAMRADIVGLNETSPQLAAELASGHYNYRFAPTLRSEDGSYGNALLINRDYEVLEYRNIPLPDGGREPRAALHVQVDTGSQVLNVFVAHLTPSKWNDSQAALRYEQSVALMDAVDHYGPENAVVIGDLNEESGRAYDHIAANLSDGVSQAGLTHPATFSNGYDRRQLDHIMLDSESFNAVGGGRSGSGASDHEALGIVLTAPE